MLIQIADADIKFMSGLARNELQRKYGKSMLSKKESVELDEAAVEVRELELFITNNGNLYKQRIKPIIKNYRRKIGKGVYDEKLASKGFLHAVADGIREYNKEFGAASMILTRQQKEEVALLLLRNYQDEIREGVDNDEKASAKILDMIN